MMTFLDRRELKSTGHQCADDLEHPTQALADCYTILANKGNPRKLKIAFIGDIAANTANSLMLTAVELGAKYRLGGAEDFKPNTFYFNKAREYGEVEV